MLSVIADDSTRAELHTDLDELAREGARPRSMPTWPPLRPSGTSRVGGWWCATATPASARS
jgi:hypothetical protein